MGQIEMHLLRAIRIRVRVERFIESGKTTEIPVAQSF